MNLTERIMRIFAPACERQRMEFRQARDRMEAYAEDLKRTVNETVADHAGIIGAKRNGTNHLR